VHSTVADYRREEILFRPYNISLKDKRLLRMPTVFNAFKADDARTLEICLLFDKDNWRLKRIEKDIF
jgi:hypothetical protein